MYTNLSEVWKDDFHNLQTIEHHNDNDDDDVDYHKPNDRYTAKGHKHAFDQHWLVMLFLGLLCFIIFLIMVVIMILLMKF